MQNIDFNLPIVKLKEIMKNMHISDIAVIFEEEVLHRQLIIDVIGIKRFSEVYLYLNDNLQVKYYLKLNDKQKQELLKHFKLDDLKTFIELFRVSYHDEIFAKLNKDTKEKVLKLLKQDDDTVGSHASPHFINLSKDLSIAEVTSFVTKESNEQDEIDVIFLNDNKRFIGAITLQDLITARKEDDLNTLIDRTYPYSYEDDLLETSVRKVRNYDVLILPILNNKKEITGIITQKDALEIMQDDHLEAISGLVQLHDHEENSSVLKRTLNRLPWLLMSVFMNIVIASFLTGFSDFLNSNIVLVMFQPMILGMAGNIGTQSIAVTILGLHQEKVQPLRHIKKEFFIGLINSLLIGLVAVLVTFIFLYFSRSAEAFEEIKIVPIIVGISLFFAMLTSALVGVLLPFTLRKLGADEKAAAGPIISTVNDFVSLFIYFVVALTLLSL